MTTAAPKKKIAITVDADVLDGISEEAEVEGTTVSGFVNAACMSELRARRILRSIGAWEAEHGEITEDELRQAWTELLG